MAKIVLALTIVVSYKRASFKREREVK